MAGSLIETSGRRNFELMAERIQKALDEGAPSGSQDVPAVDVSSKPDYEI